jgi:hypothetical protein
MHIDFTTQENFLQRVIVGENEDDCWGWTGAVSDGTAITTVRGAARNGIGARTIVAARVSWILAFGDIPDDVPVRRSCGNKTCVNPRHLYLHDTDRIFWIRVCVIDDEDSCWEWNGPLCEGYGHFSLNRRNIFSHRYAYEMEYGPIPDGMHVCHHCDNRLCCRPSHLFLGTNRDNMDDKVAKGRQARWETVGTGKLTWPEVRGIRRRVGDGENQRRLAEEYGVSPTTITNIKQNVTWRE